MPGKELMLHPTAGERLTLEGLAAAADLHPNLVKWFIDYGLLEPISGEECLVQFDISAVRRLRRIRRLRDDLGINLAGIAVVLDLLERTEALQRELAKLRRR